MKNTYLILLGLFSLIISGETFAQNGKTVESKVTDLLSRMPSSNQQMAGRLMGDMLSLGESGLKMICDKVIPVGAGNDASPRFAIENFSGFLSGKNMGSDGAMWENVCISFASRQTDIGCKRFFYTATSYIRRKSASNSIENRS